MPQQRTTILGGGVAGLALAGALSDRGEQVLVADPHLTETFTKLPAGAVNPAMGRRAKRGWEGEACGQALRMRVDGLARWRGVDPPTLDHGILRPAITDEQEQLFREAIDKYGWVESEVCWLDPAEVAVQFPHLPPSKGALHVRKGYVVQVREYMELYRDWLREKGVQFIAKEGTYDWTPDRKTVTIRLQGAEPLQSDRVIVAAGYRSHSFPGWETLPLHNVKGEMVHFRTRSPLMWKTPASSLAFAIRTSKHELIAGSNYDHHAADLAPTQRAREYIEQRLLKVLPSLEGELEWTGQWAGYRVTTPNRLPVLGRHPKWSSLGIFSGFNSSGLLYSEYCAGRLADHLLENRPLPTETNVSRLL